MVYWIEATLLLEPDALHTAALDVVLRWHASYLSTAAVAWVPSASIDSSPHDGLAVGFLDLNTYHMRLMYGGSPTYSSASLQREQGHSVRAWWTAVVFGIVVIGTVIGATQLGSRWTSLDPWTWRRSRNDP